EHTGDDADEEYHCQPEPVDGKDPTVLVELLDDKRPGAHADEGARDCSIERHEHRLAANDPADLASRAADGPKQADLACALEHVEGHGIADAKERHHQRQREHSEYTTEYRLER